MNLVMKPVFSLMIEKGLDAKYISNIYKKCDFYNSKRSRILSTGFQRLFDKDYISALHILVPQFEACLREMLNTKGISTTTMQKENTQHEQMLSSLLNRKEVKVILGENFYTYICLVMNEANGWNLRNDIAHGLATDNIFDILHALVVFHLFIRLFNVK